MTWNESTLARIVSADDLKISPFRADGETFGTPTWIWSVAVGDALYVRAYNGRRSRWYRSAIEQGAGRIHAAGEVFDVTFEQAAEDVEALVTLAYEQKYRGSTYLPPMIAAGPVSATVRIRPRA
jgi:hypothetical protein